MDDVIYLFSDITSFFFAFCHGGSQWENHQSLNDREIYGMMEDVHFILFTTTRRMSNSIKNEIYFYFFACCLLS